MHEYSIVRALMAQVSEQARARRARQIVRVRIRLGELSGVDPDLLDTAFSIFSREHTLYCSTVLEIDRVPLTWGCPSCRNALQADARLWCPDCDVPARLVRGDEIILDQIEMELDDVH